MTNKKNFNRLIKQINSTIRIETGQLPDGFDLKHFNQGCWQFECGAPGCMAGHGMFVFNSVAKRSKIRHEPADMVTTTCKALDIEENWAIRHLFNPPFLSLSEVRPEEASAALAAVRDAGDEYQQLANSQIWSAYYQRRNAERVARESAVTTEVY